MLENKISSKSHENALQFVKKLSFNCVVR